MEKNSSKLKKKKT